MNLSQPMSDDELDRTYERLVAERVPLIRWLQQHDREPRSVEDVLDDETREQLDQAREDVDAEHADDDEVVGDGSE